MPDEKQDALFFQLVMGLQSSAWMMLGKIANPVTGKLEKNLEAAKATIDTLIMLKEKTKGNLSKQEEDFLSNAITQLELNYVEEAKKEEEKKSNKAEEEAGEKKEVRAEQEKEQEKGEKESKGEKQGETGEK